MGLNTLVDARTNSSQEIVLYSPCYHAENLKEEKDFLIENLPKTTLLGCYICFQANNFIW